MFFVLFVLFCLVWFFIFFFVLIFRMEKKKNKKPKTPHVFPVCASASAFFCFFLFHKDFNKNETSKPTKLWVSPKWFQSMSHAAHPTDHLVYKIHYNFTLHSNCVKLFYNQNTFYKKTQFTSSIPSNSHQIYFVSILFLFSCCLFFCFYFWFSVLSNITQQKRYGI